VGDRADRVVWLCDPLHANTVRTRHGQKTRVVSTVLREIEQFCAVLRERGVRPRGLHLEVTPDAVTECVDTDADLAVDGLLPRYESACDPRLNAEQSERVVRAAARLFACHGGGEMPSGR
jgi:3-deoxy-7-phosphoheptulonate synthase